MSVITLHHAHEHHDGPGPRIWPLPTSLHPHFSVPTSQSAPAVIPAPGLAPLGGAPDACPPSSFSPSSSSRLMWKNGATLICTTPLNIPSNSFLSLSPDWWKSGEALYSSKVTLGSGNPPEDEAEVEAIEAGSSGKEHSRSTPRIYNTSSAPIPPTPLSESLPLGILCTHLESVRHKLQAEAPALHPRLDTLRHHLSDLLKRPLQPLLAHLPSTLIVLPCARGKMQRIKPLELPEELDQFLGRHWRAIRVGLETRVGEMRTEVDVGIVAMRVEFGRVDIGRAGEEGEHDPGDVDGVVACK